MAVRAIERLSINWHSMCHRLFTLLLTFFSEITITIGYAVRQEAFCTAIFEQSADDHNEVATSHLRYRWKAEIMLFPMVYHDPTLDLHGIS